MAIRLSSSKLLIRSAYRFFKFNKSRLAFYPLNSSFRNIHTSYSIFGECVQFKLSDIGEGIREVVLKEWHVKVGDRVAQFDSICEVQSDKAAVTITSRYDGVIKKLYHDVDNVAFVGHPLLDIELDGDLQESSETLEDQPNEESSSSSSDSEQDTSNVAHSHDKVLATPSVRRIATENNIKLKDVVGTGKDGRVLKEDILQFLESMSGKSKPPRYEETTPSPTIVKPPPVVLLEEDKKVPLKGIMKVMKKTMSQALQIPHFAYCDEVNMTNLVNFRQQTKALLDQSSAKLSYMPYIIKASSLSLMQFPMLNAHTDETCDHIIFKAAHNIGVAMDTPDGLLVPSIKNVQNLSILDIAEQLQSLMDLGLKGKLKQSDLSGGTFTLSNIGNIGGTYTKPVILPPEVIIGGIGRLQKVPRYDEFDNVVPTYICNISWSADHRVTDGATVARFSNLWKRYLENPQLMLLHLR